MANHLNGKIIKGIGGFYYVETAIAVYECKARGVFRKQKITPLVGDNVTISINENAENTIDDILPRSNCLVRPPLANIDVLFIVSSLVEPNVNLYNIDKLIAIAEYKNIEPIIVFTKSDLSEDADKYANIYLSAGFKVIISRSDESQAAEQISALFENKVCAFTGNTGVGKSTLLNIINPDFNIETGETSKKLGRGRHTTRHCELYKICGGYVADTPGFSSLDFERCEHIMKDELFYCFREFQPYEGQCKFNSCTHMSDKGCAVKAAVDSGEIPQSRHQSYCRMYDEVKDIKEWEMK